jgi:hypothetical protein
MAGYSKPIDAAIAAFHAAGGTDAELDAAALAFLDNAGHRLTTLAAVAALLGRTARQIVETWRGAA